MPHNPLYSFFSSLFGSDNDSLQKGTMIQIQGQQYVLRKELVSYLSKNEDKESPIRFAFIGGRVSKGFFGSIKTVRAYVTPKGLRFDGDKPERKIIKIFKDPSETLDSVTLRDMEYPYASSIKTMRAKKTGNCSDNCSGMLMRYFEGEHLGRIVRQESYQMTRAYEPLHLLDTLTLSNFFYERNTLVKIDNGLYEYQHDDRTMRRIVPTSSMGHAAHTRLMKRINALPFNTFENILPENMQDLALLKCESLDRYKAMSVGERLQLSLNLLRAYKEQIFDSGLSHNDIKPENIIINRQTATVHFIDFGFTKRLNDSYDEYRGSPLYSSPEMLLFGHGCCQQLILQSSSDLFSLGKVLAFLWGVDLTEFGQDMEELMQNNYKNLCLTTLFSRLSEAPERELANKIQQLLKSMIRFDPEERSNISSLISKFEKLEREYTIQDIINSGPSLPGPC